MTFVRTRLACDGKVIIKVSGRGRKNFEVLFLDKYRRKSLRNLRYVLERLNVNIEKRSPLRGSEENNIEIVGKKWGACDHRPFRL